MPNRIVQKYYSIGELAWTYGFDRSTIRRWIMAGDFGPLQDMLHVNNKDIRVPTSGALFFESRHQFKYDAGTKARNLAELKRKLEKGKRDID